MMFSDAAKASWHGGTRSVQSVSAKHQRAINGNVCICLVQPCSVLIPCVL